MGRRGQDRICGRCVGYGVSDYLADFEGAGLVKDEHFGGAVEFFGRYVVYAWEKAHKMRFVVLGSRGTVYIRKADGIVRLWLMCVLKALLYFTFFRSVWPYCVYFLLYVSNQRIEVKSRCSALAQHMFSLTR